MSFWVYLLRCADGRYYTGHTDDLDRRFAEHQAGGYCDYTSRRLPVSLVWSECFVTRLEALEAERVVGGWSRAKKEALITDNWPLVSYLARPPKERFSTSLETNGGETDANTPAPADADSGGMDAPQSPFVSSEVEKQGSTP